MIRRLDKIGALCMLSGMWVVTILAWLSYVRVRPGAGYEPHHVAGNLDNDTSVCNLNLPGMYNTKSEISCYLGERVTMQTHTLWRNCDATLYNVLNALETSRKTAGTEKPRLLKVLVIVNRVNGQPRTTCWGTSQERNLLSKLRRAVNEWNSVLASEHPNDFFTGDIELTIASVVEPTANKGGVMRRYENIVDTELQNKYSSFPVGSLSNPPTWSELKTNDVGLTIEYQTPSKQDDTKDAYAHVATRPTLSLKVGADEFVLERCFPRGPTIIVNDTMGGVNVQATFWDSFVPYALLAFVPALATSLATVTTKKPNAVDIGIAVIISLVVALVTGVVMTYTLTHKVQQSCAGLSPSHPDRFASDAFPAALMTHELGHALLITDHYQNVTMDNNDISNFMPGPVRQLRCSMTPISVMGAENHVTPLDRKYVTAMWKLLRDGAPHSSTEPPQQTHSTQVENELKNMEKKDASACVSRGAAGGTGTCVTNAQAVALIRTSLPDSVLRREGIGGAHVHRVSLTPWRGFIQQYIFTYSTMADLAISITFSVGFLWLWWTTGGNNLTDNNFGSLVPTWTVPFLWGWVAYTVWRAHAVDRCIDTPLSWASILSKVVWMLIVPLFMLTCRRIYWAYLAHTYKATIADVA